MKNKMKTHKGLKKRIKITGTGKWMHKSANTSHLAGSKTKRQKKRLDQSNIVSKCDFKRLRSKLGL